MDGCSQGYVQINVWSRSLWLGLRHQLSRPSDFTFPASLSILPFSSTAHVKTKELQGKFGKIGLPEESTKGEIGQQIW